ncbi:MULTISPECIES: hypothetical protein [unclassified Streptomyces]|uniref:hypothetical protein n=1 Tax=unclassified Streptomyces TaxID=2593676 RepID=UPI003830DF8B
MQHTISDRAVILGIEELESLDAPDASPSASNLPTFGGALQDAKTFGEGVKQAGEAISNAAESGQKFNQVWTDFSNGAHNIYTYFHPAH